jgi:hypothetical protein
VAMQKMPNTKFPLSKAKFDIQGEIQHDFSLLLLIYFAAANPQTKFESKVEHQII